MAVDPEQMAAASTAADASAAREAEPTPSAATEGAAVAPQFDIDAYYAQYESAPEDARRKLAERFLQAEPIRKQVSAESSRAIQRANQQAQQAQARQAEIELDYILADENHPRHYEALEQHGTARKDVATQRVGIRTAIERPEVRSAAKIEVAQYMVSGLMASGQYPDVTPDDWAEALQKDDLVQSFEFVNAKQRDAHKNAWIKEMVPAIEAQAMDKFRAGLPNPDAGRSVTSGRTGGPLTPQTIQDMDAHDFIKNADAIWASLPSGRRD